MIVRDDGTVIKLSPDEYETIIKLLNKMWFSEKAACDKATKRRLKPLTPEQASERLARTARAIAKVRLGLGDRPE